MAYRQQQYGFIESEENPFDDGPMPVPAPQRQPPRSAQGAKQPRAPAQGQPLPPPQQQVQRAQVQQQPRASAPQQPRAPPAQPQQTRAPARSTVAVTAVSTVETDLAPSAPAARNSGFSMPSMPKLTMPSTFGSVFGTKASAPPAEPMDELAQREAALKAREAAMAAKEAEVAQREKQVKSVEGRVKNWPFKCAPFNVYYHSIKDEIPAHLQPMVKKFYAALLLTWIGLIWNVVTVFTYWGESDSDQGTILCIMWLGFGIPGSWSMWYFRVYKGAASSSSRQYLCSFVGMAFHLGMMLIVGLGVPGAGTGGLLVMLKAFAGGYTVSGVFSLIDTALLLLNFVLSLYNLKKSRDAWQTGGGGAQFQKDRAALKMAGKAGLASV